MARQSLGDLLSNLDPNPAKVIAISEEVPPIASAPSVATTARRSRPRAPVPSTTRSEADIDELPNYLRLVRKETRLREDQQNQLTFEARRLNRSKPTGKPRITDNTLIRIGVDLLLERIAEARGADEAALLESLRGQHS